MEKSGRGVAWFSVFSVIAILVVGYGAFVAWINDDDWYGNELKVPAQSELDFVGEKLIQWLNGSGEEYFLNATETHTDINVDLMFGVALPGEGCRYDFSSAKLVDQVRLDPVTREKAPDYSHANIAIVAVSADIACGQEQLERAVTVTIGAVRDMGSLAEITQIYDFEVEARW